MKKVRILVKDKSFLEFLSTAPLSHKTKEFLSKGELILPQVYEVKDNEIWEDCLALPASVIKDMNFPELGQIFKSANFYKNKVLTNGTIHKVALQIICYFNRCWHQFYMIEFECEEDSFWTIETTEEDGLFLKVAKINPSNNTFTSEILLNFWD